MELVKRELGGESHTDFGGERLHTSGGVAILHTHTIRLLPVMLTRKHG